MNLALFPSVRWTLIFVVVIIVGIALSVMGCEGETKTHSRAVDVLSFIPPAGWEAMQKAGGGPMTISNVNQAKGVFCDITVYNSLQSSGDLARDFFSEWTEIIGSPIQDIEDIVDGGTRIEGRVRAVSVSGKNNHARLITYRAGTRIASIIILTPNSEAHEFYRADIDSFLASVTVNSPAINTQSSSSEQQAQTQASPTIGKAPKDTLPALDNPVWVAEWKKSTRMSELSGKWINNTRDGGTYWTETLYLRADGSFSSTFEQRGSVVVNEENHGTWTLSPRPSLEFAKGSPRPFNIIHFTQLPDGSSTMITLNSQYPINDVNRMAYQTEYTRPAP